MSKIRSPVNNVGRFKAQQDIRCLSHSLRLTTDPKTTFFHSMNISLIRMCCFLSGVQTEMRETKDVG